MKIVLSTYTFFPEIGGVATHVATLAHAFAQAGHEVIVVTTTDGPIDGYSYQVVRNPDAVTLTRYYADADILILSNLSLRLIYPLLAMKRSFALWHHSESAFHLSENILSTDRLRRRVRDRAFHIMTSAFIGAQSGLPHYIVIRPFIDMPTVTIDAPLDRRRGAFFAGRLEPEKGILDLIGRWPLIQEVLGENELRIAGDGSCKDEVARAARCTEGIVYLGPLPLADTRREMSRAAFSIVPSLWPEPFGLVAIESIAAGAITISSDRGGLPEAIGGVGILYDPDDPISFSNALHNAGHLREEQRDPDLRAAYRARLSNHLAGFSPTAAVNTIISAFERGSIAQGKFASDICASIQR